jgi:carboxypeptidase Q
LKRFIAPLLILCLAAPLAVIAAVTENVDYEAVTSIRQEGFRNSQVMNILSELTDRIGPRLTGSPNMKQASEWTRDELTKFGLSNSHLEKWGPFGRGWSEEFTSVRMIAPTGATLFAIPRAWTPSTNGPVKADVIRVKIDKKEDFDKYRGQLAGKIVLSGDPREIKEEKEAASTRYSDEKLAELAQYNIPASPTGGPAIPGAPGGGGGSGIPPREEMARRIALARETTQFFADEKVAAVIEPSRYNEGEITMSGTRAYQKDQPEGVPTLNMAVEHWGRIVRLLDKKVPVELEVNVKTRFYDDDPYSYNTIADIPGSDKKIGDEVVMMGAHLDSWHGGTGATDNAAGAAIVMEAARILRALDLKPRRTIRVALWSGEEQGLYGSRAYVKEHLASRPDPTDPKERELPSFLRHETGPLTFKSDYKKVSAYFNIDNGTGKLRGIFCQENAAVCPIFAQWLEPLRDLGVTTVSMRNTGSTDHVPFDAVGVPGFQFIQDPVEYFTRTHHSNMDVYERIQRDDVMQAAVVLASVVWQAANRDQMLPRKPLPKDALQRANTATQPKSAPPAAASTGGGH